MTEFPKLKTGAVAQYPLERRTAFATGVVRFVDGGEQRYAQSAGGLRTWSIRLDLLDDSEAGALAQFFDEMQGAFGTFTFTDPSDGSEHPNCTLGDEESWYWDGEMRAGTVLLVRENRG